MNYKMKGLLSLLLFAILFTSCSNGANNNKEVFCARALKFNRIFFTNDEYDFSFTVNLLTKNKDDMVEFDSFDGENVHDLSITLIDNIFGNDVPQKIDGYYIRMLTLRCKSNYDSVRIDKAFFRINGEKAGITFDCPIKATRLSYDTNDYESGLYCLEATAGALTPILKTEQKIDYLITSNCDVVITDIKALDFLIITDSLVVYNDIPLGTLEEVLPLKVNKNDQYRVWLSFNYDEDTKIYSSYYDNVSTTISFNYILPDNPEKDLRFDLSLNFEGIFNEQSAEEFIKLYRPN